jgi:chromosome segregation protein
MRDQIDNLRRRLESLGPVNLLAMKEVEELEERSTFLGEQRRDLVESLKSLDATIRDIDATCTERFVTTFEQVNAVFTETFTHLFGGGTARLDLVDEDNPLESGIDITAQPPGKKNQSVQLLSGGEKALAALSLLIALFRIKPSPFCILDEVDAPLDDANVDRLNDLVRSMTEHTQFVLITHNRRTMQRADVLYGVTMEEPGVSKLVTVRLEG